MEAIWRSSTWPSILSTPSMLGTVPALSLETVHGIIYKHGTVNPYGRSQGMSKIHLKMLNIAQPILYQEIQAFPAVLRAIFNHHFCPSSIHQHNTTSSHVIYTRHIVHIYSIYINIFQLLRSKRRNIFVCNKIKHLLRSIMEMSLQYRKLYKSRCRYVTTVPELCAASQKIFHIVSGTSLRNTIFLRLSNSSLSFLLLHRSKFTQPSKLIRLWSQWITQLIRK